MRGTSRVLCVGALFILLTAPAARAVFWYVTIGGTGGQTGADWDNALPTVTAGLQAASAGDTVRVWVGIYPERITLKPGVLLSGGHFFGGAWLPFWSILDGGGLGTVVTVPPGAGPGTHMEGFTIQNGTGTPDAGKTYGGGILVRNASPKLSWNHVTNNRADIGAGVYLANTSADIYSSHITRNVAAEEGGGVAIREGSPMLYTCTFRGNSAPFGGGLNAEGVSDLLLAMNVFEANHAAKNGSALYVNRGKIFNNTIWRNTGPAGGSVALASLGDAAFTNNIIASNSSGLWMGRSVKYSIRHNNVHGNVAGNYYGVADPTGTDGNISADPALADPLVGDYTPVPGSPCIDKGDDSVIQPGWLDYYIKSRIAGVAVDIGAAEWQQPAPKAAIRVKPAAQGGSDAYAGADWDHAMATVQAAINNAVASNKEVWVAAGTYGGITIENANVMVYGGFAGTETERNQRDPAANTTVLSGSGSICCSVVTIFGSNATGQQVNENTVLDGFTIRDGSGYAFTSAIRLGGGIACFSASPVISGNIIEYNTIFQVSGSGGGVYVEVGAPYIARNVIRNNEARQGGGIYVTYATLFDATAQIRNNVIEGNEAGQVNNYPGIGGGLFLYKAAPIVTGNLIRANRAENGGGGLYCQEFAPVIRGNRIESNTTDDWAGGLWCAASAQILNNVFAGNEASQGNGGVTLTAGKSVIANNLFARNKGPITGGLDVRYSADADIYGNTFYGNENVALAFVAQAGTPILNVSNNIFANSATGIRSMVGAPSTLTVSNNAFHGNAMDRDNVPVGPGDITADPRFIDPAADDFRLRSGSPLMDAGNDAARVGEADLDGQPRLYGPHVDIGAYERGMPDAITMTDAMTALRIAAGLTVCGTTDMAALNVENTGASQGCIDMTDACLLIRQAGMDP